MLEIILDGALMTDRQAVHDLLTEKFAFPDYYGRNLDALYDLLSTYSGEVNVTLIHESQMYESLGNYGKSLVSTLRDAAAANINLMLSISDEII